MPVTINGIGTRYAGRANVSERRGTCEFCRRTTTLTSYETREFFCVIFIPLVPMTKYRIFDYCSSCRKHRRAPQEQFAKSVATTLTPLRDAIRRDPRDADARQQLIGELAGLRMITDAEIEARAAVDALPENAAMNRIAGDVLSMKGDVAGAEAFYRRAAYYDPNDAAARAALGRILYLQRKYADATRPLEEARRLAPADRSILILLAECYCELQRWQEALALYQQSGTATPPKPVLRRIAECKKKLGYELTPAERKASRRWWPFGRRKSAPIIVASRSGMRPATVLALIGGAMAILIAFLVADGWYNSDRANVYFDSVFPQTTFDVDGNRFNLDVAPVEKTLHVGKHHVKVISNGKVVEEKTIDIDERGWPESVFDEVAYVYNTGGLRVYRHARIEYAADRNNAGYGETLGSCETFFRAPRVDYLFVTPPDTVELSSESSKATKTAFTIAPVSPFQYAEIRLGENRLDDAAKALQGELAFAPCDMRSRELLVGIRLQQHGDDALAIARDGVRANCSDERVRASRLVQDTMRQLGKEDEVLAQYRDEVNRNPNDAVAHYLFGRIQPNRLDAMAEERRALQLDPNLGWAHVALGYDLLGGASYAEAMDEFGAALRTGQHDERVLNYYTWAAIAAGRTAEAHAIVDGATKEIKSQTQWMAKWNLALAEKRWADARVMYAAETENGHRFNAATWMLGANFYRLGGDHDAYVRHLAAANGHSDLATTVAIARIQDAIIAGDWKDAMKQVDAAGTSIGEARYVMRAYAAAAALLDRNAAEANQRVAALLKDVDADKDISLDSRKLVKAYAAALTTPDDVASSPAMRENVIFLSHVYFFMAARAAAAGDAARARELFRKSAAASFDLDFPLMASQRLASS